VSGDPGSSPNHAACGIVAGGIVAARREFRSEEMAVKRIKPEAPTADNRWKLVDVTMRRNGYAGHALIETLHTVQDVFGYIDDPSMRYVAQGLNLPLSKVYGVATFYHLFTLKPKGKHTCVVCTGTACYIKGAGELVEAIQQRYHVRPGQTTADSKLSVVSARCVGACGLAPAVVLNGTMLGKQTSDELLGKLERELEDES
jgi:bidirectional [NiFe] hydrogenase diaphorase subunit